MKLIKQIFSSHYLKKSGYLSQNINSIKDKAVQKNFRVACKTLLACRSEIQIAGIQRINDIIQKYNMCDDNTVIQEVKKHILNISKEDSDINAKILSKAEMLLDGANVADKKYCILSKHYPFFASSYTLEQNKEFKTRIKDYCLPEIRKIYDFTKKNNQFSTAYEENLYKNCLLDSIKDFITASEDEDINQHLWNKYFLSNPMISNVKKKLEEINKNYGVKIFFDSTPYTITFIDKAIDYIEDEFKIWRIAGRKDVIFPKLFNITKYVINFFKNESDGDANVSLKRIRINGGDNIQSTIRHEMMHLNDKSPQKETKAILIPENRKSEMRKNGLSDGLIKYAGTSENEYKAVFAEGDMDVYSDEFKKEMVEKGVPEFVTKLKTHGKYTYELLKEKFNTKEQLTTIERLHKAFEGDIPVSIREKLLQNPDYMEILDKVIDNQKEFPCKEMSFEMEMNNFYFRKLERDFITMCNNSKRYSEEIEAILKNLSNEK